MEDTFPSAEDDDDDDALSLSLHGASSFLIKI